MTFIAKKPTMRPFQPVPAGMYVARCYSLVDLGTHKKKAYKGVEKGMGRKIQCTFELLSGETMPDGRPFSISTYWWLSMHEMSPMRINLESWRGKKFTEEEEQGFDVKNILGKYCLLNAVTTVSQNGGEFTNIGSLAPLLKEMTPPAGVNQIVIFDLDAPDIDVFHKLSEKTRETIIESQEWHSVANKLDTSNSGEYDDEQPKGAVYRHGVNI